MSTILKRDADEAFVTENADKSRVKRRKRSKRRSTLARSNSVDAVEAAPSKANSEVRQSAFTQQHASTHVKHDAIPTETIAEPSPNADAVVARNSAEEGAQEVSVPAEEAHVLQQPAVTSDTQALVVQGSRKKRSKRSKANKHQEQDSDSSSSWKMSTAAGGIFINHDPVLSPDNKYLVLATSSDVQIYSSATSLLVRSISSTEPSPIVSYSLSTVHDSTLLVGYASGSVMMYSLDTGRKLAQWQVQSGLTDLFTVPSANQIESIVTIHSEGKESSLQLCSLAPKSKSTTRKLLQKPDLQGAASVMDGSVVVAFGKDRIFVGHVRDQSAETDWSQVYTWYELPVAGRIVSYDVRFTQGKSKQAKHLPTVDVAVGLQNGAIIILEDLLQKLITRKKDVSDVDTRGQRLHWHRKAVQSVKWSRDGNYLISGGDESVLVMWQLETNQKQFLPHLSTTILNITVSKSGAHYALRLADNSVMVLLTADLTPSTSITGLSFRLDEELKGAATLHPGNSNQLLAAVPSKSVGGIPSATTHLQTFDIDTNLQLSKQALTRNLTTAVNVGPNGARLEEPSLAYMDISFDGKWLTTIDKWSPNSLDMQAMYLADEEASHDLSYEITMRFWSWDASNNSWELVTRVDEPHMPSRSAILAMARSPVSLEFTTMGGDGCLKIWTPKLRVRDGIAIRNAAGEPLYTWSCTRQYQIEKNLVTTSHPGSLSGALAYSEDGTVLAASWSSPLLPERHVHLINSRTGTISLSQPQLLSTGPATLCFMSRYLLALSDHLTVFDIVTLHNISVLSLESTTSMKTDTKPQPQRFLAVSPQTNTFALGINPIIATPPRSGLISIFDIETSDQGSKSDFTIQSGISALLASPTGQGFVVIDRESQIRKITPPGAITAATSTALMTQPMMGTQLVHTEKGVEDIFGSKSQVGVQAQADGQLLLEEGDVVQARSKALDDLLSSSSSTASLPGVNELFERVAKAVIGVRVGG